MNTNNLKPTWFKTRALSVLTFPEEFKKEDVRQVTERGYSVTEVGRARHLNKSHGVLRQSVRVKYAFIRDDDDRWPVRWLCRLLDLHPSGYYAWRVQPQSRRTKEDRRIIGLVKQFWLESGGVYGYQAIYATRDEARVDVFDYIELFYN